MRQTLFIYGTGGHAKVVADIARLEAKYELKGFVDDDTERGRKKTFLGLPVRWSPEFFKKISPDRAVIIVAIGNTEARKYAATCVREKGFAFGTAIHPMAVVAQDVSIGEGTVVMAGAVINPGAKIGKHVIVNTRSSVDHDCEIDDYVHIAPGAVLGGGAKVGKESWIGIGAFIREYKRIGAYATVGMGSVVTKDIPDHVVVWGNPAKIQRKND